MSSTKEDENNNHRFKNGKPNKKVKSLSYFPPKNMHLDEYRSMLTASTASKPSH